MDASWRDVVSSANRWMLLPWTLSYLLYQDPLLGKIWNDSPDRNLPCDCRELVSLRLILVAAAVVAVVRVVDDRTLQHRAPPFCRCRRGWEAMPLHELANTEVVVVGAKRIAPVRRDRQMIFWILPIAFHLVPQEIIRC